MRERHAQLAALFEDLCDRAPDQQAAAIAELAEDDASLARELASLLELDGADLVAPLLDRFGGAPGSEGSPSTEPAAPIVAPAGLLASDLPSGRRYRIVRKLGEGGLGVVYEADDLERGQRVALKTFKRAGSDAIFRLKREFRSLAGIDHPNLVSLYDLVVEADRVFFTMELVAGTDVLSHVRADEAMAPGELACDLGRLRQVLPQLARGLSTLHGLGKLHRDIKPSNVLVTEDGRVVVCDFGLAVDIEELENESVVDAVVGTIAYMSPEQACAERSLGPATDWYAFGVLLFEALTGVRPFSGRPIELVAKKTQRVAPPPSQLVPGVPPDLDELCQGLLRRDPASRTRGSAVLEALGVDAHVAASPDSSSSGTTVAGRDAELATLDAAFAQVQQTRQARAVVVSGPSGIGKSAVVSKFLERLRRSHHDVVVLRGRCYEWEAVSHRAMDNVIDGLSRCWRRLPELEAGFLCPQEPHLLPVLFPVLGRVAAIAKRRRHEAPADPQERRDRAYAALRETFRKLATDRPVAIFVDDMQWADSESCALLAELLLPPHPPAVLLVLGTRDHDLPADAPLSVLMEQLGDAATVMPLPPLSQEDGQSIAASLLGSADAELAARVAREARGNAFFLTELCRAAAMPGDAPRGDLTVDDLVRARVQTLSEAEREALMLVAIAGHPIGEDVIETAAALTPPSFADALRSLRATSLLRTAGGRDARAVECYHDRIREAVVARLPVARARDLHRALAEALEVAGNASAERLARHWQAAGDAAKAAHFATRAAADARAVLDFSRAADLFATVLELGVHAEDERRRLLVQRGDALVEGGRPAEAVGVFEEAMATAPPEQRARLRGRVVQQLLALGKLERGIEAAAELTRSVGWRMPRSPRATIARVLWGNVALWIAGDVPTLRRAPKDPARLRTRIDIATELARSLSLTDSVRGLVCTQRAIRDSFRLDDDELRARMLAIRSISTSARGDARRSARQLALADELATRSGSDVAAAYTSYARGFHIASVVHDWPAALRAFERATRHWSAAGRGEGWDLDSIKLLELTARAFHGELRAINDILPQTTLQYARSGRRFLEVMLRTKHGVHPVLNDRPDDAIADVADALSRWPAKDGAYLLQHLYGLFATAQAELYRDRPTAAAETIARDAKRLRRSLLLRVIPLRVEYEFMCGRTELALATAAAPSQRRRFARRTARHARWLADTGLPLPSMYALMLRAGLAELDGQREAGAALLREAHAGLEATGTMLVASCVKRQLGSVLGGNDGERMVAEAEVWMARQDVPAAARATALYLPGWSHPG